MIFPWRSTTVDPPPTDGSIFVCASFPASDDIRIGAVRHVPPRSWRTHEIVTGDPPENWHNPDPEINDSWWMLRVEYREAVAELPPWHLAPRDQPVVFVRPTTRINREIEVGYDAQYVRHTHFGWQRPHVGSVHEVIDTRWLDGLASNVMRWCSISDFAPVDCRSLGEFVDGEMGLRADAFRTHLRHCADCGQESLSNMVGLVTRLSSLPRPS